MIDLTGASVDGAAYLAVPIAVLGLGLVVGAWFGRARWLIPIGLVLVAALAITTAARNADFDGGDFHGRPALNTTWPPTTVDEVVRNYNADAGNATLDLSKVDFADSKAVDVDVQTGLGNLTVLLPPNVDVEVHGQVDIGDAAVLGNQWGGVGQSGRTVTDNGADGEGGGKLVLNARVNGPGNLEVHR
jgi:hypothetical protein